jgi:hypothetical protein
MIKINYRKSIFNGNVVETIPQPIESWGLKTCMYPFHINLCFLTGNKHIRFKQSFLKQVMII